jgi:hypothetical protein
VERLHRQIKDSLSARQCGTAWLDHLPWTLLGLRAAPKDDSGISSAEVVFGEPLHLPGQLHVDGNVGPPEGTPPAAQPPSSIPLRPRTYAEAARGPLEQLARARYVFVRKGPVGGPLALQYEGPYEVLDRTDKVFRVQCGPRVEVISADRLKPYGGTERPELAAPPRAEGDCLGQAATYSLLLANKSWGGSNVAEEIRTLFSNKSAILLLYV